MSAVAITLVKQTYLYEIYFIYFHEIDHCETCLHQIYLGQPPSIKLIPIIYPY